MAETENIPTIKFSHRYFKMPNLEYDKFHYLIGASVIHYKDLPKLFIDYDTIYYDNETKNATYYELPKTVLIVLTLFSGNSMTVWTTVRRYTEEKYRYYQKLIGQRVRIEVSE